jgi:hypothetical protein
MKRRFLILLTLLERIPAKSRARLLLHASGGPFFCEGAAPSCLAGGAIHRLLDCRPLAACLVRERTITRPPVNPCWTLSWEA